MTRTLFLFGLIIIWLVSSATKLPPHAPKNYHQVSETLYRSGQPKKPEMIYLEQQGIKTIFNLRNKQNDKREIKGTSLKEEWNPMRAKKITYEDMLECMKEFKDAPKPALVHCRRGSDRTGCFVACYRIIFENSSKEKAIKELMNEEYGYMHKLFPNIREFIEQLDVQQFRSDIFSP